MASLQGTTPADTYQGLLKTNNNNTLPSGVDAAESITDGLGNESKIKLHQDYVDIAKLRADGTEGTQGQVLQAGTNGAIQWAAVPTPSVINTTTVNAAYVNATQETTSSTFYSTEYTAQLFIFPGQSSSFYNFGTTSQAGKIAVTNPSVNDGFVCNFIVASNTLYIDQPIGVGFGYALTTSGTTLRIGNTTGSPSSNFYTIKILNIR